MGSFQYDASALSAIVLSRITHCTARGTGNESVTGFIEFFIVTHVLSVIAYTISLMKIIVPFGVVDTCERLFLSVQLAEIDLKYYLSFCKLISLVALDGTLLLITLLALDRAFPTVSVCVLRDELYDPECPLDRHYAAKDRQ